MIPVQPDRLVLTRPSPVLRVQQAQLGRPVQLGIRGQLDLREQLVILAPQDQPVQRGLLQLFPDQLDPLATPAQPGRLAQQETLALLVPKETSDLLALRAHRET